MSTAIDNLKAAMKRAVAIPPRVGGFPYLAESLRQAVVTRNIWSLPACRSFFMTERGLGHDAGHTSRIGHSRRTGLSSRSSDSSSTN